MSEQGEVQGSSAHPEDNRDPERGSVNGRRTRELTPSVKEQKAICILHSVMERRFFSNERLGHEERVGCH